MAIRKLDKIFNPRRIALVGVTINPNSVGGKVLANLVGSGYRGVVYPVNPDSEAVLGIQCYPDVKSLPRVPDLAVICSAAAEVPDIIRQCGEAGILGVIILSAGFRETGEAGLLLENRIKKEAARFDGMRIIGPNCLGIIVPGLNLNVSFATGMPKSGHIAFISQSGALCTSVLDWAIEEKIGFSNFVSIGNSIDVTFGDLIDFFGEDENTEAIILYIESIRQARRFMTAARAFARTKPILAYKAGRFPESARVAASHTGALASEDDVYDAAFQRVGVTRVYDIGDIFDCAGLIGRNKMPGGARLGIITNAGGPGVMATDALIASKGVLAKLSENTMAGLNECLPPSWSHGNPVDVLGDANSKRIEKAARLIIADRNVDAMLVILTPQAMTNPTVSAKVIAALAETTQKPILAAWLGGLSMNEGIKILIDKGIPTYKTPEQAIRAFMTLVAYARNLETLYETPKELPVRFGLDREKNREAFITTAFNREDILSEETSKALLETYGIAVAKPHLAKAPEEAVEIARKLGFPVVLKIQSPEITHKTDAGGVAVNLEDESMVLTAYQKIIASVKEKQPQARLDGITVQPMINAKNGIEMIAG
ncbi:MAG: acetate--CoA ligase family protein, partial [candidate division Zixibacteria bacterium]|nr:acetate--CoA ligase family protein [candidate division Zixibacteria bacterium]